MTAGKDGSGTWAEELAGLRREVVELLESANDEPWWGRWAIRFQAQTMWRQLDVAETIMNVARDRAVEEWLMSDA